MRAGPPVRERARPAHEYATPSRGPAEHRRTAEWQRPPTAFE
ncbi:hypothetical protein [Streptomyces sp. NPDC054838]